MPRLLSIALAPERAEIVVGATQAFTATGRYSDEAEADLTGRCQWRSANPQVAAVGPRDGAGQLVVGLQAGRTTLLCEVEGVVSLPAPIEVQAVRVIGVSVEPAQINLPVGGERALRAFAAYNDGNRIEVTREATWLSLNPAIARVADDGERKGRVTGVAPGEALITASFQDSVSLPARVAIQAGVLEAIELSLPAGPVPAGRPVALEATGIWSDGARNPVTAEVEWQSSAPAVADFDPAQPGRLLTRAPGLTQITARLEGVVSLPGAVTVGPAALESLRLRGAGGANAVVVGGTLRLETEATWSDGRREDVSATAQLVSETPALLGVVGAGEVLGLAPGAARVVARLEGITSPALALQVQGVALEALELAPDRLALPEGALGALVATGRFNDGSRQDLSDRAVWASANPAVASVAAGRVQALRAGETRITATLDGLAASATVVVEAPALAAIEIAPAALELALGASAELTATAVFVGGARRDITAEAEWSSSAPAVLAVTGPGQVRAEAVGAAQLTATWRDVASPAVPVQVGEAVLVSLTVTPDPAQVIVDEVLQLTARGRYSDGRSEDLSELAQWLVEPAAVASVSNAPGSRGALQGLAVGEASVRASVGGVLSPAVPVTVLPTPNRAPVPRLSCPEVGRQGEPLDFSAEGSVDPDGEIFAYRWRFGDGGPAIDSGLNPMLAYTYDAPGRYTVELTVVDDAGGQATARCELTVSSASAPTVRLVRPQGSRDTTQGEVIAVEVDARAGPGRDVVQVALLLDGREVAVDEEAPWSLEITVPADAATGADLRLVAQATDDTGDSAVSAATLLHVINAPPEARFNAIPFGPRQVRVDARGVSDDFTAAADLQVRFDFEDDGAYDTPWSVEKLAEHAYPDEGEYVIRMQVRDGIGQVSEATRLVRFQDQQVAFGDIESAFWSGVVTVTGSVRVLPGHTLTVGEGTVVQVVQVDQDGNGVGDYGIDVQGQLVVQGTPEAPVTFQGFDPGAAAGAWRGIVLAGDQPSALAHVEVAHANRGLEIRDGSQVSDAVIRAARDAGVYLSGASRGAQLSRLRMSALTGRGLWLVGAQGVEAADVVVDGCGDIGLRADSNSTLTLTTGSFQGCGACGGQLVGTVASFDGVRFDQNDGCGLSADRGQLTAVDGSFSRNGAEGLRALRDVAGTVQRSQITDNGNEGVRWEAAGGQDPRLAVTFCNIHGNGAAGTTTFAEANPGLVAVDRSWDGVNSQSALWQAPDEGVILAVQVTFDNGTRNANQGLLLDERGRTVASWNNNFNGWVYPAGTIRGVRVAAGRNTSGGSDPNTQAFRVLYRAASGAVRQLTVGHLGAAVDARYNYLGDFPLVLDDVQLSRPASLDLRGFVGVPYGADWDRGVYRGYPIEVPTVWSGSVWLTGDVEIAADASLTIEAGTTIRVAPLDQDGNGVGDYTLTARGPLVIEGTAQAPVVFLPDVPTDLERRAWQGVDVFGPDSRLDHLRIQGAELALELRGAGAQVSDADLRDGHLGLLVSGGAPTVSRLRATQNTLDGARLLSPATLQVARLSDNGDRGLWIQAAVTVEDAAIVDNGGRGVDVTAPGATLRFCEVSGNGQDGLVVTGGASLTLTDSAVQSNGGAGVWFQATGAGAEPSGAVNRCNLFGNARGEGPGASGLAVANAGLSATDGSWDGVDVQSGIYEAPGPIERVRVSFNNGGRDANRGALRRADTNRDVESWNRNSDAWVALPANVTRIRVAAGRNTSGGNNPNTTAGQVWYRLSGLEAIELSAAVYSAGRVDARENYWGVFPDVQAVIHESAAGAADLQGFVPAARRGVGPRQ